MNANMEWDCAAALHAIHTRLDGEFEAGSAEERQLEQHLVSCAECREADIELRAIQEGLREFPLDAMPDVAMRDVLNRTVRSRRRTTAQRWGLDWRLAAAAVVTVGVIGMWYGLYPPQNEHSDAELARAATEARAVLALTAQALRKTERTVTRDVLADEVSPALRRVPIRWPSREADRTTGGRAL